MSLEQIINTVDSVELSGHLLDSSLRDYCDTYGIDDAIFDGHLKPVALKAIADVAMVTMIAALMEGDFDFDELLMRLNFGEQHPVIALMQHRMLDDHKDPVLAVVEKSVYEKRFSSIEKWIKRVEREVK